MFVHDEETNALGLRDKEEGHPWVSEKRGEWLYCADCYDRWLNTSERSRRHFVPFSDKASQGNLKPTWNRLKRRHDELERDSQNQEQPEASDHQNPPDSLEVEDAPIFGVNPAFVDVGGFGSQTLSETPADGEDVVLPHLGTQDDLQEPKIELAEEMEVDRPNLQEYQAKWANLLEHHSRSVQGPFCYENLCPIPAPQLWSSL